MADGIKFDPELSKRLIEGDPNGLGAKLAEKFGDFVLDKTGSPLAAASAKTLADLAPMFMAGISGHGPGMAAGVEEARNLAPELDMSHGARMERAAQQGYDLDMPLYHSSDAKFTNFKPSEKGRYGPGIYTFEGDGPTHGYGENSYQLVAKKGKVFDANEVYEPQHVEAIKKTLQELNLPTDFPNMQRLEQAVKQGNGRLRSEDGHSLLNSALEAKFGDKVGYATSEPFTNKFLSDNGYIGLRGNLNGDNVRVIFNPEHVREFRGAAFDPNAKDPTNMMSGKIMSPNLSNQDQQPQNFAQGGIVDQPDPSSHPIESLPHQPQTMNLIDPESGDVGSVPVGNARAYISQGYRQASPEETNQFLNEKQYGGAAQQALTGIEGAAQAATFGLSTGLERALGVPKEDIQGRKETNPITHMVGQGAGLIGSAFVPGVGAANILEHAGTAGAEALGLGVTEGASALSKVGSAAVKGAIENTMVQGGDEVSRMIYQDPNQSVQTAVTDLGLSALLGGGISGALGAVHPLWMETTGGKLGGWLEAIQRRANGESVPLAPEVEQALKDTASPQTGPLELPPELRAGMSEVPDLAKQFNLLQESKTMPGQKLSATIEGFENAAADHIVKASGRDAEHILSTGEISNYDAGVHVQDSLADNLKKIVEPVSEKFDQLTKKFDKIPLNAADDTLADKLAVLAETEKWTLDKSLPGNKLVQETLEALPNLKTMEDLRKYQSLIWSKASGNPELYYPAGKIVGTLRDLENKIIDREALSLGPEAGMQLQLARSAYKSVSELVENLNERLRVGKYNGPGSFIKALKEMKPEEVLSRLSKPNDVGLLQTLESEFPEIAQKIREHQLSKVLGAAATKAKPGQSINMKTFFTNYEKMTPEMRNFVFGGAQKQIDAVRTLVDRIPSYKSSGTAGNLDSLWSKVPGGASALVAMMTGHNPAIGFMLGQTGKWLSRDAPDAIRLAFLKFLGHDGPVEPAAFKSAVDFISSTIKGQNMVKRGAEAVFKSGRQVLTETQLPSKEDRDKLDKKLKALQKDTSPLLNTGGKTSYYMPEHTASMGQTAASAVNYLNSLRPNTDKRAPLDPEIKPSAHQTAAYHRALDIAQQPLVILDAIKHGELTPDDVKHLQALYPDLYNKFNSEMMNHVIAREHDEETIPYKTKLALSLFMGQPLDSSMTPASLQSSQIAFQPQGGQQPQQGMKMKHSSQAMSKLGEGNATPGQTREMEKSKLG